MHMPPAATLSRKRIISCVLLNLLGTPGLGSIMARRWVAGAGQLLLSVVGFILILVWFYRLVIVQFYGQMNGSVPVQPVGQIGLTGLILFAAAWLWTLATSVSLLRNTSQHRLESLESFAAGQIKMDEARILLKLAALPQWQRRGEVISRTFTFPDFPAAMKFVNAVADLAGQAQHEPDIDVRRNRVTLAFTSRDACGLTEKDFAFARQCDGLAVER
jgi:4a-hydroxytetrahydrobiopterin dehydratase